MKRTRASKIRALILVAIMVVGVIPINAFANELTRKNVVNVSTSTLATSMNVLVGTDREDLGLPDSLEVAVESETQNDEGESQTTTTTENAPIHWDGDYDSSKVGDYVLTAAFDSSAYQYAGTMPTVTIHVLEDGSTESIMTLDAGDANGETQEINLVDINKITASQFRVKPAGSSEWVDVPGPVGSEFHVGDDVHIKFDYATLDDVTPNNVYYFDIPSGLSAIAGASRGDITSDDGRTIGTYWVEDGKVKMQFTNTEYLEETGNEITEGFVNFYARLNQSAVDQDGVIKIGNTIIGTVPIVPDEDVTNVNVDKMNGDGTDSASALVYDATKNAVQYTFEINTNGNNKTIDKISVVDTLTTTVNNEEDSSIVAGDYTDITITPSNAATFTKRSDGKYVLTANNVAPDQTIKVTYWVPVKNGIVQAKFVNDVEASKTIDGTTTVAGEDSVQGSINNTLDINKQATKPVFDPDTATTTVTYTVTVKAPTSNTTAIANAYVYDEFDVNGDFVTKVDKVSGDGTFGTLTTGKNANFKVELGTMAPGETKTYTYTATLDSNKCYFYDAPGGKWFDNHAYAKAGNLTFDQSKASLWFEKHFTEKNGTYDAIAGKYRFILTFDGTIPGTDGKYYDKVLKSFHDEITSKNATYAGDPAPVLQAMQGDEVVKSKTLDGSLFDGKDSVDIDIPTDMQGAYSYRLIYYVNLPEGTQQTDKVTNKFTATAGVGSGGADLTFESTATVSAASAKDNAMTKALVRGPEIYAVAGTNEYSAIDYAIDIKSPLAKDAVLTDKVTQDPKAMIDILVPLDFLRESLTLTLNGSTLQENVDYKLEAVGDKDDQFKITFLKAFPDVSNSNPIEIRYTAKVVSSDYGKGFATNEAGGKIGSLGKIANTATLDNNGMVTEKTDTATTGSYIEKKAVDTTGMNLSDSMVVWDIVLSYEDYPAFGRGYHPLVDTLPANLELVKIERFEDDKEIYTCTKDSTGEHGYTVVENADGTSTVTINAFSARRNHSYTYRLYTRVKDSALIDANINPDYFDNVTFTNSAYYETLGTKWNVSAETQVSRHNNEKTYKYDAETEHQGGVEFTLKINEEGLDMDATSETITVCDTMNRALTLKKDTLRLNGKTIDQVPGASLIYDEGSNTFTLKLPDKTPFTVTYIAEIDAEAGESGWLSNEAYVEGRYGTVTTESTQEEKLNISAGSSSKLTFYLKKLDKDGNLLTGAKFQLRKVTLKDGELTETPVDVAGHADGMFYDFNDGTYKFRGVSKGVIYAVEETEAPTGFVKDSEVHYVYFGTPDAEVKAALEADGKTVTQGHTGGATKLDTMFDVVNEDAVIDIPVTKKWDDASDQDQLRPDSITVNLKADGTVIKSQTLTAANAVAGQDNTWSYTFTNLPTHKLAADGKTREEIVYTVEEEAVTDYETPVITKDQDGNGYTITNKHEAAGPTTATFSGKKTLTEGTTAKEIQDGQFQFTVTADADNPATIGGLPTDAIAVQADGTFDIGTLTFTKAGTYKITVSEVQGAAAGYTYDNKPVTVTIPVTLNKVTNKLQVGLVSYEKDGAAVNGIQFDNTYTTPGAASKDFTGKKTLTENGAAKGMTAGQFEFTVTAGKNNPGTIGGLPTGTVKVNENGTFDLGTLTFPKAGTYTFTVAEVDGGQAGYTYDSKPVTVTVPVTFDEATNTLNVGEATYEKDGATVNGIQFDNTYTTPGSATELFAGKKTLKENGADKAMKAGQFEFKVTADANNPAGIGGLPTENLKVSAEGNFSLGTLSFPKAGTYKITVEEVNGGAEGYTYDANPVTATIVVKLDTTTNKLVVDSVAYEKGGNAINGFVFDNTYTTPDPIEKEFKGSKTLTENGEEKEIQAGQFEFKVTENENNPAEVEGLPTENLVVDEDGNFDLGAWTFRAAGTYQFVVEEINGGAAGYTYDANPVAITVVVTLNEDTNKFEFDSVTYEKKGEAVDGIEFENTYTTPDPAEEVFTGTKNLTENGKPMAIKDGQFKFTVTEDENNPAKIDGLLTELSVKADGTFDLGTLKFPKAGTYVFTIAEVNGGEKGYTYDEAAVKVTVEVVLNEDTNQLEVKTVQYEKGDETVDGIVFNNTHEPDPTPTTTTPATGHHPNTGDTSNMGMWMTLLVLAGALVIVLLVMGRKRRNDR